ncbi:hypothetical protein H6P81_014513 [Aristolochia fimbriata]|uniref:2Fe-2S ferredoxin-type domain-containing protein n=1 Tax=Aristolochia fimbriata TaxID=158543 RepID=A0AAV7EHR1_ARIFI|nr:hypothetical protein H6P81_014513 [Aristolochia fimbriata]
MEEPRPQAICGKEALDLLNCITEPNFDQEKCLRLLNSLRDCVLQKKVIKFSLAEQNSPVAGSSVMFTRLSLAALWRGKELKRARINGIESSRFFQCQSNYKHPVTTGFFSTTAASKDHEEGKAEKDKISVTFVDKDGEEKQIKVPVGMSMLEAAHENDIELEGACEGSLACSTCHVIVTDVDYYNRLSDPTDEENDMLDLAFGLTETSRLGCQVIAKPEIDGIRLALPSATRNFAVDGFVPKPH